MKKLLPLIAIISMSKAAIVSFDGGIASTTYGDEIEVTNSTQVSDVDFYREGTIILSYNLEESVEQSSWQTVGDYYGTQDSVIHGHWEQLSSIEIQREGNTPFDLQYFQITSNTSVGGGPSTGTENIAIQGFLNGIRVTELYSLPGLDWGASTIQDVFLPNSFDNVDKVFITDLGAKGAHTGGEDCPECNSGFCFGMDNFVFDEVVPENLIQGNSEPLETAVPEVTVAVSGTIGSVLLLLLHGRRRFK